MTGKIGIYFAQNYGYRLQDIREYDTVQGGLFCVETVVRQKENKLRSGLQNIRLTITDFCTKEL